MQDIDDMSHLQAQAADNAYHGSVYRQELVYFCREEVDAQNSGMAALLDGIEVLTKAGETELATAMYETLAEKRGFQRAMRVVCEWAKEKVEQE